MNHRVVHEVPKRDDVFRASTDRELDIPREIVVRQVREEGPHPSRDARPRVDQGRHVGIIGGIELGSARASPTAIQPAPLGTQDVDE